MTSDQTTPAPEDERAHAEAPAEGAAPGTPAEGSDAREHATDPAEGADDA